MAATVAGEVLGPRPGMAIVSFTGGIVETVLRVLCVTIGVLPALVAAAVAIGILSIKYSGSSGDVVIGTYGSGGFVVGFAGLALITEVLLIVIRFCNIGVVNLKIKVFLVVDIVLSVIFCLGHLAGGIAEAVYAADYGSGVGGDVKRIRDSLIASAVFCFLAAIVFADLAVWMTAFMVKNWNDKVVKYTLKEAMIG